MNKRFYPVIKRRHFGAAVILACLIGITALGTPKAAHAQVTSDVNQFVANVLIPIRDFAIKAYEKGGAAAFQKATRVALNKIAYDTATWLGSGNEGQKPMFVTKGWDDYLAQIGDEAAGEFIENAVNNWANSNWKSSAKGTAQNEGCTYVYDDCRWDTSYNECTKACPYLRESCYQECRRTYPKVELSQCEANLIKCNAGGEVGQDYGVSGKAGSVKITDRSGFIAVCEPSSLEVKLKISLGLVNYQRPKAPNCSATELVKNWEESINSTRFLDDFKNYLNPVSNDLGIYLTLRNSLTDTISAKTDTSKLKLESGNGWLDLHDIGGNLIGLPNAAEVEAEQAKQGYLNNMATFSGDALIDAASVFLNQLALTTVKKWMNEAGESKNEVDYSYASADPNVKYGEKVVKESAAKIIEPDFSVKADYDILSSLSMCRDRNNPGPTECVIDDKMMSGVTEKKTVAEAIKEGYLHKEWIFTSDYRDGAYNLRNIQVMRKYRLVPVGWEVAAKADKQATLIDLVSCYSPTDEYNEYSSNFDVRSQTWCQGLVDPNWVLKAPLNYCAKQGFSSQILDISVIPGSNINGEVINDKVQITRAGEYCADEKTCIKEKEDGSCEAYGYCQSERRTWSFDSKSCAPIDNTCSAFINSTSGQRVSYLENTLDYGNCNADSAGCKRYSVFGVYATSTGQVSWSSSPASTIYFNERQQGCAAGEEGCTELLRAKPGWGANLIMGSGFGSDNIGDTLENGRINGYWPVWSTGNKAASIVDASEFDNTGSGKAMLLESAGNTTGSSTIGLFSDNAQSLIPSGLNLLSGETYTFSADVYLIDGEKVHLVLGGDYQSFVETRDKQVWRHLTVTRSLKDKPLSELSFQAVAYGTADTRFAIRNLKLEMNPWDSGYTLYGSYKAYEKIIPPYLEAACYENSNTGEPDYRLRPDAPSVCSNFARRCNREEAGCERYVEESSRFSVAAQAVSADYCDASCNGYDLYVSRGNYFFSPEAAKIIPAKSKSCSAAAAGCAEFTNLDEVANGGETREYYTQLKQCIKPGESCGDFYTWIGSDESGYQLKALSLKKDANGLPAVTVDDSAVCNEAIFNLPVGDPGFNPDCRQYYNKMGQIAYHLTASTITCSDNCHTYRQTEKNIDSTLTQDQCTGSSRSWNAAAAVCYSCQNGGTWSDEYQSCLYQAIPQEGKKCSASQNGCREYNGSLGNNTRLIGAYNFENGLDGWEGRCGDAVMASQAASNNNGKSMLYDKNADFGGINHQTECTQSNQARLIDRLFGTANAAPDSFVRKVIGNNVSTGRAYSLKFTASASTPANISVAFLSGGDQISYFNATADNPTGRMTVSGNDEWKTYEVSLANLDHVVDGDEALVIVSDRDFYIDNMVLTEITDRYYLIKGSSQIPDVCYYDMLDNYQGEDYNLGCSLYSDRAKKAHYLRGFNRLCQDSAVGCELMVETANYDDYKPGIWKDTDGDGNCDSDEDDCVSVAGDRFVYAIYDDSKRCNSADSGCSRLGQAVSSGQSSAWSDVFKRNEPDSYDQILCEEADAGCEGWKYTDGSGISYFKNPGNDTCVYRLSSDPTKPGKNWYKVPVMRCDQNNNGSIDTTAEKGGPICASSTDCANGNQCLVDNNEYDCPVSYLKTIGYGGGGQRVPVPSESAGLCEPVSSGCTEYIDPVSSYSPNMVYNPSLNGTEGWTLAAGVYSQQLVIEPNTLYIFSINTVNTVTGSEIRLEFPAGVSLLQENNELSATTTASLIIPASQPSQRYIFHSRGNSSVKVTRGGSEYEVVLRPALVNYQFKQKIDQSSCNGIVNVDNGCVLFNQRSTDGSNGYLTLSGGWNAAASLNGQTPVVCTTGNCNANKLIKVRPDRVCASWLDCLTYTVDPETNERTCFAIGECNRLGDDNTCTNFVAGRNGVLSESSGSILGKVTGYSVLGQVDLGSMKEVGLNTEAHYNFEEGSPNLSCKPAGGISGNCKFDKSLVLDSIVNKPAGAPTDYPAEGKAYLRVVASQEISPHSANSPISIQPNQDYYLNYLVNTKGSSASAYVAIYGVKGTASTLIASTTAIANNGWERKIFKISKNVLADYSLIAIYLGAKNANNDEVYAYFDDVNIEPVLSVGGGQYIAKECRLFPSQDAVSCSSLNNKVVSDGLVGYCLQHDPVNKRVCQLWFPIDEISAAAKSGRSTLGYQGAYPLNYCTEANGNFTLSEKRAAVLVGTEAFTASPSTVKCFYEGNPPLTFCQQNKGSHQEAYDYARGDEGDEPGIVKAKCQPEKTSQFDYFVFQVEGWQRKDTFCIPYNTSTLPLSRRRLTPTTDPLTIKTTQNENAFVYDVKDYNGWYVYNGVSASNDRKLNELNNSDPAIRVYDYDHPTVDEDQLKLVSSQDPDEVFYPTCNKFIQVVDDAGVNKAWAARTSKSSIYPYQTPIFFNDGIQFFGNTSPLPSELTLYGRNRETIPFGGATFPEGFNIFASDPVKFRSQYSSKINQEAFAGRPWGCSSDPSKGGIGCGFIGQCSLNPNVICLFDPTNSSSTSMVNQRSCGSANGSCVKLWDGGKINSAGIFQYKAENVLRSIFLKSFGGYEYKPDQSVYESYAGYSVNGADFSTVAPFQKCTVENAHSSVNDPNFAVNFCGNYPSVSNVRVNGLALNGSPLNVASQGIYTLTFNSIIDSEQQPMRSVIIDWGDNTIQTIVNQDNRPSSDNPHKIYHFYKDLGQKTIKIKVTDNWELYCCSKNGSGICSALAADCPGGVTGTSGGTVVIGDSSIN